MTVGNVTGTEPLTLQGKGISQTISGSSATPSEVIETTTNSTSAFQVQNASGTSLLGVDTQNSQVTAGTSATTTLGNTSSGTNTLDSIYYDFAGHQGLTAQ